MLVVMLPEATLEHINRVITGVQERGYRAHLFRGTLEQNVIYHVMADALGY